MDILYQSRVLNKILIIYSCRWFGLDTWVLTFLCSSHWLFCCGRETTSLTPNMISVIYCRYSVKSIDIMCILHFSVKAVVLTLLFMTVLSFSLPLHVTNIIIIQHINSLTKNIPLPSVLELAEVLCRQFGTCPSLPDNLELLIIKPLPERLSPDCVPKIHTDTIVCNPNSRAVPIDWCHTEV